MKIESIYDKNLKFLTFVFIFLLSISLPLVGIFIYMKFSHYEVNVPKTNYGANIVYTDGKNTIMEITNDHQATNYHFSITGYNFSDQDIPYSLTALKGMINELTRVRDEEIIIELTGSGDGAIKSYGPVIPQGLSDSALLIGKGYFPKNSASITHDYIIKIWFKNDESILGDISDSHYTNKYYSLNFDIQL